MVHPNDIVLGGWDISSMSLADAMERSKVLDWGLQEQLRPHMKHMTPLPSIYYPDFIAANQSERADNVLPGSDKKAHLEQIRKDIREFKSKNGLDKVILLWTANTERFAAVQSGVNDTADNLMASIEANEAEIAPSTVFAVASILEGSIYINGSPQVTWRGHGARHGGACKDGAGGVGSSCDARGVGEGRGARAEGRGRRRGRRRVGPGGGTGRWLSRRRCCCSR